MPYHTLTIERDGPVATVWLSRPERRNALNLTALEEIEAACHELQKAFDVAVVVFAGRGPSFCAGADRKDPPGRLGRDLPARERRYYGQVGRRALEAVESLEAITIARLHGHAIGGGLVLALGCDFRLAAAGTIFHVPEVDLGIPLTWGAVPRLAREIGMARARELVLICDRIDAVTAERYGLVHRVVPEAELDATVAEWAGRLAAKPPWALHMSKTQFRAYGHASVLGDVTEGDCDLLGLASAEDPTRFLMGR